MGTASSREETFAQLTDVPTSPVPLYCLFCLRDVPSFLLCPTLVILFIYKILRFFDVFGGFCPAALISPLAVKTSSYNPSLKSGDFQLMVGVIQIHNNPTNTKLVRLRPN